MLSITATVIIAQIICTMTLEKLKPICAADRRAQPIIVRLVQQQSLGWASLPMGSHSWGDLTYDEWPRVVLVQTDDNLTLGMVVMICVIASAIGIRRTLRVEASTAVTGLKNRNPSAVFVVS